MELFLKRAQNQASAKNMLCEKAEHCCQILAGIK